MLERGKVIFGRPSGEQSSDWYEGRCENPSVYPEERNCPVVVYNHLGEAFTRPIQRLGFDLSIKEEK